MEKAKQWIALTAVLILLIGVGGWFLLISPRNQEASDIRTQAEAQDVANAGLRTQISVLKAQAKALPRQQAKLAAVAAKIPNNPALPSLIRALTAAADDAGVELLSLSPSQPAAVTVAAAPVVVAPSAAPVAAPAAGDAPVAAPVTPGAVLAPAAAGAAGTLKSIALNLSVVGGYFQVEQFLDRLESLTRAMKVSAVNLTPGANPNKPGATAGQPARTLSATITGTVYMASARVATAAQPIAPVRGTP